MELFAKFLLFAMGAVAGGLIERLLEEILPDNLQKYHILWVVGAIIGLILATIFIDDGQSTSPDTFISSSEIGDSAIFAGRDVIIQNSTTDTKKNDSNLVENPIVTAELPTHVEANYILGEDSKSVNLSFGIGENKTIQVEDEFFTINVLHAYPYTGVKVHIVAGQRGDSTIVDSFNITDCIRFHQLYISYLRDKRDRSGGFLGGVTTNSIFAIHLVDENVIGTDACSRELDSTDSSQQVESDG